MTNPNRCPGSGQPASVISTSRFYCPKCGKGWSRQSRRMTGPQKGQPVNLPNHNRR